MKRFSRSIIGLMEQCNDGEWVRYKDAQEVEKKLQTTKQLADYYLKDKIDTENDFDELLRTAQKATNQVEHLTLRVVLLFCLNLVLFASIVSLVVK